MRALNERDDIDLVGVFSQPDRRRGRGQESQSPPVARFARELDLPLFQPEDINRDGLSMFRQLDPLDLGVLIAYGQFLDPEVFDYPEHGTVNFHASLLPRWRGATPIRHTLLEGDDRTGVTIFRLVKEMDAGPICWQEKTEVRPDETYGELYERLAELNVKALSGLLEALRANELECRPQRGDVTYAPKLPGDAARIRWSNSAKLIERHVRAFSPDPGAYTHLGEERLKIYRAKVEPDPLSGDPGEVVCRRTDRLVVAAAPGALRLLEVQPAGSRKMNIQSFLAGHPELQEGSYLGSDD